MYADSTHGSTLVDPDVPIFRSFTGSLSSNSTLPGANEVPVGDVFFGTSNGVLNVGDGNYLAGTGQDFNLALSMVAAADASVVFEADLSFLGPLYVAENWSLSLGARTNSSISAVTVEFSTDATNWTPLANLDLTDVASPFTRAVAGNQSDVGYFRLGFDGTTGAGQPRIDNVTISGDVSQVPEPGTAMLMLLGLTGLGMAGRRRA
jgi:hypothetical protein